MKSRVARDNRCRVVPYKLYLCEETRLASKLAGHQEDSMAEKSKQPKEPKKKPQKTMMEKRKEKREKEASKHEE